MKWLMLSIAIGFLYSSSNAQHDKHQDWDENTRKVWIDSVLNTFDKKQVNEDLKLIKLKSRQVGDVILLSCKVKGEGILNLNAKEWIYFISNSNHNNPGVGDITIAIDRKGKAYINEGHVCGGIINFITKEIRELNHVKEFFRYFVSDTDDKIWKRIDQ